jgi:hypothetical protein
MSMLWIVFVIVIANWISIWGDLYEPMALLGRPIFIGFVM